MCCQGVERKKVTVHLGCHLLIIKRVKLLTLLLYLRPRILQIHGQIKNWLLIRGSEIRAEIADSFELEVVTGMGVRQRRFHESRGDGQGVRVQRM